MTYTSETCYQLWNDDTGERIEVGPDSDCLGFTDIRCYAHDGTLIGGISLNNDQIDWLFDTLSELK